MQELLLGIARIYQIGAMKFWPDAVTHALYQM